MTIIVHGVKRYSRQGGDEWDPDLSQSQAVTKKRQRRRVIYRVTADAGESELDILSEPGVPQLGEQFGYTTRGGSTTGEPDIQCVSRFASHVEGSPSEWQVECVYSDEAFDLVDDNPLLRKPDIEILTQARPMPVLGAKEFFKTVDTDDVPRSGPEAGAGSNEITISAGIYDVPITNSAGEPFDPVPEMDREHLVIRIGTNAEFTTALAEIQLLKKYSGSVNSFVYLGCFYERTLLLRLTSVLQREKGITFWRRTIEMEHNPETWLFKALDQGTYYWEIDTDDDGVLDAGTGQAKGVGPVPFATKGNTGQQRMGNLDGKGGQLAADAGPVWITKHVLPEVDFRALVPEAVFTL